MPSANAANRLIQYYLGNARRLPWRTMPGEGLPDPYRVWLSEVMLQQTTVAAVSPRFERFVSRWPTVQQLASAPEEDVLSEWAGLGYYARARNLIACARHVAARGAFPDTEAELRRLPGIGEYTAAAIAAIAFGERSIVVDTNVRRVAARLCGLEEPVPDQVKAVLSPMVPAEAPGDFAQAMMDLGATICRPLAPACKACPLASDCIGFRSGDPVRYPKPKLKAVRPVRAGTAFWIERDGHVWLVRRPEKGLLGGMVALPGTEWNEHALPAAARGLAKVRHVFTHFALDLSIVAAAEPQGDGWWQPVESLDSAGLPTLYRKAAEAVLHGRAQAAAA
jgi:A/G-specific adenine glycosylase